MNAEKLFSALGDVGEDLLQMAEQRRFVNPWRRWGVLAACFALVVSFSVLALPYFPMGCGASSEAPMAQGDMEYVVSDSVAEEAPMESPETDGKGQSVTEEQSEDLESAACDGVPLYWKTQVQNAIDKGDDAWLLETFVKPQLGQTEGWTLEKATYADDLLCLWLLPPEEERDPNAVTQQWLMTVRIEDDGWHYQDFASAG